MSIANCLLVGLGRIGMGYDVGTTRQQQIMSHARALALSSDLDFLGAVDPSPERRELFEASYERCSFESLELALAAASPDIVVIASPTETHLSVIEDVCRDSSPTIILCEKPLAYELHDAEKMIEICKNVGVQLFVNYMRRVDPATNTIRDALMDGTLGPFAVGACFYSKGLVHNASHFVNLLEFWFGSPTVVKAEFAERSDEQSLDGNVNFTLQIQDLHVDFRSLGDISSSPSSVDLWGPGSRLNYDWGGLEIKTYDFSDVANGLNVGDIGSLESSLSHIQLVVAEELAAALRGKGTRLCTGLEALRTLSICTQVLKEARFTI